MNQKVSGQASDRSSCSAVVRKGALDTPVQLVEVTSSTAIESHFSCRPEQGCNTFADQVDSLYRTLGRELQARGIQPGDVVLERVFFSDIQSQFQQFMSRRGTFYCQGSGEQALFPATISAQQPLLVPGQLCELQVFALRGVNGSVISSRNIADLPSPVTGRVVETDSTRHIYLTNISGDPVGPDRVGLDQSTAMLQQSQLCLQKEGFSFADVVRTWLFLTDLERAYDELNRARNAFFKSADISPPPASTGIQGTPYPPDRQCGMGLIAVQGSDAAVSVRQVQSPAMGEAYAYGSNFSRGMAVELEDRVIIYISGTASIDDNNRVVHIDDIDRQLQKMFSNVEQLLASEGCSVEYISSGVTYLKRAEYIDTFHRVAESRGFPGQFVNTVCRADVCRPEWLCEVEVTAVLPLDHRRQK